MKFHNHKPHDEDTNMALVDLLDDWARWMRSGDDANGYPDKSAGFSSGGLKSFEDLEDQVDGVKWVTITTIVNDLPELPKRAIFYQFLSCWALGCAEHARHLKEAYCSLESSFAKKGFLGT